MAVGVGVRVILFPGQTRDRVANSQDDKSLETSLGACPEKAPVQNIAALRCCQTLEMAASAVLTAVKSDADLAAQKSLFKGLDCKRAAIEGRAGQVHE